MIDEITPRPVVVVKSYPFEEGDALDTIRADLAVWCARANLWPATLVESLNEIVSYTGNEENK